MHLGDTLPFRGWRGTRETLAELFCELGFKIGVEVGSGRGVHAEMLCQKIPGLNLTCVDPWKKYGQFSQADLDQSNSEAVERLAKYNVEIRRESSTEGVKHFADHSLDFVYIDGCHDFDFIMEDLIVWVPKVKKYGIVSGHDYFKTYRSGVIAAVDTYTKAHDIHEYFVTGERSRGTPSFFWVKSWT